MGHLFLRDQCENRGERGIHKGEIESYIIFFGNDATKGRRDDWRSMLENRFRLGLDFSSLIFNYLS